MGEKYTEPVQAPQTRQSVRSAVSGMIPMYTSGVMHTLL